MALATIKPPFLLFLGEVKDELDAKTAFGLIQWRRDDCIGQLRLADCNADTGLPDMTSGEAAAAGAQTLIIGVAPFGGQLPESWHGVLIGALEAGLDIASGLHSRIAAIPELAEAAARCSRSLFDVRHPAMDIPVGTGERRSGKRLLSVGTDCCVGKKFSAFAIAKEMQDRGLKADFRATGQTGILIAGSGIAVDAVVSDFLSGAAELISPANEPDHWDIIEGQGSLFHPSYAAVSLGLLHGSQPDVLVLCHEAGRTLIGDMFNGPTPTLAECAATNLQLARLTNPDVRLGGICLNTSHLSTAEAQKLLSGTEKEMKVACCDPVRFGVAAIVDALQE